MKTQQQLIEIYQHTKSKFKNFTAGETLKLSKPSQNIKVIKVINADCVNVVSSFPANETTCLLNMASYKRPGGGVENGRTAQEEVIARRSNLMDALKLTHTVTALKASQQAIK